MVKKYFKKRLSRSTALPIDRTENALGIYIESPGWAVWETYIKSLLWIQSFLILCLEGVTLIATKIHALCFCLFGVTCVVYEHLFSLSLSISVSFLSLNKIILLNICLNLEFVRVCVYERRWWSKNIWEDIMTVFTFPEKSSSLLQFESLAPRELRWWEPVSKLCRISGLLAHPDNCHGVVSRLQAYHAYGRHYQSSSS